MPQQLTLDIRPEQRPTLANFFGAANQELVARLQALAQPRSFDAIYVWGAPGSGRSHLLHATHAAAEAAHRRSVFIDAREAGVELPAPPGGLLVVDDVDQLDANAQIALFRAFNAARLAGLALLMSGNAPPRELALREDLRTRIGSALVFGVKPLTDEDRAAALKSHALQRGMKVDDDIVGYLLRHTPRDLPVLMAVLDALDRISLERQRTITLPLLREVLQDLEKSSDADVRG